MSIQSHSQTWLLTAPLFQTQQRGRIYQRIGARLDGHIVAAKLALLPQPAANPPHRWMKEE
jgi:hypothetical protein